MVSVWAHPRWRHWKSQVGSTHFMFLTNSRFPYPYWILSSSVCLSGPVVMMRIERAGFYYLYFIILFSFLFLLNVSSLFYCCQYYVFRDSRMVLIVDVIIRDSFIFVKNYSVLWNILLHFFFPHYSSDVSLYPVPKDCMRQYIFSHLSLFLDKLW